MSGASNESTNTEKETVAPKGADTTITKAETSALPKPQLATKAEPEANNAAGVKPPSTSRLLRDEEDDDIDEKELYSISGKSLRRRLGRYSASQLRANFGTDDIDVVKKKLARAEELEKGEEDRRREKLDAETRMKEDLDKAVKRADAAEERARVTADARIIDREDTRLYNLATDFFKGKYIRKAVFPDLRAHLRKNYSAKELVSLRDADLKNWFAEYAKENPELSRAGEEAQPAKEKPAVAKAGITTGSSAAKPSPLPSGAQEGRTFKPGQPNSYTRDEARAQMKKMNINY